MVKLMCNINSKINGKNQCKPFHCCRRKRKGKVCLSYSCKESISVKILTKILSFLSFLNLTLGRKEKNKISAIIPTDGFVTTITNNGGVCDVAQGDRTYSGQIKGPIGNLTNLKYDVLMACLDQDIQISRYQQFRHSNEINMKIFHIRFLSNH